MVKSYVQFLCSMTSAFRTLLGRLQGFREQAEDSLSDTVGPLVDQLTSRLLYLSSSPEKHLAPLIDHTNLMPTASQRDIAKLCGEAKEYGFASVCITPHHVEYAASLLSDSPVAVCTVVGFPLGATYSVVKAAEATFAIEAGASEIDMVVNHTLLQDGSSAFRDDIAAVADAVQQSGGKVLKVILEAGYHTPEQVAFATRAVLEMSQQYQGVRFFTKTSTGMEVDKCLVPKYTGPQKGARTEDLQMILDIHSRFAYEVDPESAYSRGFGLIAGIKASGGVRTTEDAVEILSCKLR